MKWKFGKKNKEKSGEAPGLRPEHYDVLVSPVVTEKSTLASDQNKVVFRVRPQARKEEIKRAVEGIFGVKVAKVNTIKLHGKTKRFKGTVGQRSDAKKAVVTLAEGQRIDLSAGVR